jgi:DNA-binding Xre family transcriptional regulator
MNKVFPHRFTTPSGDTMVILPLEEYEALLDAADVAAADRVLAEIVDGRDEFVPETLVDRLLGNDNRVRVWREYRKLTATDLASRVGISAAYLSELEAGKKKGGIATLKRLAVALNLDLDDLVA